MKSFTSKLSNTLEVFGNQQGHLRSLLSSSKNSPFVSRRIPSPLPPASMSMSSVLLAAVSLWLHSGLCLAKDSSSCERFDSNMGATFDITDLVRPANAISYMITDGDIPCTKEKESNFTYVFNLCAPVAAGIPDACRSLVKPSSAALQINFNSMNTPDDDWCYAVGEYADGVTSLSLLDSQDPTKGVRLEYLGNTCSNGKQRRFKVEMPCADRLNPTPVSALELEHCQYTVVIPSVYGCPLECPVADRKLCGGNGHCHYDFDQNSAHCFCNKGFSGKNCMTTSVEEAASSPVLTGLIVTLTIIVVLLGAGIGMLVRQVSAYRQDMANYHKLRDEDDSVHQGV